MDKHDAERFYYSMNDDLKFRYANLVRGAIFGQAVGDALGHPIEFKKTHVVTDLEDDNKFTDDTQMFCAIGEAMLDAPPHKGVDEFMDALTKRFVEWRQNPLGGSHRAPGGTCMEAVRKLGAGRHWRQSGALANGKGNGSAMRAGIVGARYWKDAPLAFRVGCLTSVNTHNNLESILAAGMVAFLVARSIQGCGFPEAVAEGLALCADFENQIPDYPTNTVPMNNTRDGQSPWKAIASFSRGFILGDAADVTVAEFLKENGNDFTSVPAVAEAIFFNARHDNFDEMALECANASDDSDTITAIAGTIAGARFGFAEIGASGVDHRIDFDWGRTSKGIWTERVEMHDYLDGLSTRIFEASLGEGELEEALAARNIDEALGDEYAEDEAEVTFEDVLVSKIVDDGEIDEFEAPLEGEIINDDFEVEF
jgi:ADP-ribosyl-[dinitrogen reductase] hydrolase